MVQQKGCASSADSLKQTDLEVSPLVAVLWGDSVCDCRVANGDCHRLVEVFGESFLRKPPQSIQGH